MSDRKKGDNCQRFVDELFVGILFDLVLIQLMLFCILVQLHVLESFLLHSQSHLQSGNDNLIRLCLLHFELALDITATSFRHTSISMTIFWPPNTLVSESEVSIVQTSRSLRWKLASESHPTRLYHVVIHSGLPYVGTEYATSLLRGSLYFKALFLHR